MSTRRHFMSQSAVATSALAFPLVGGAQPKTIKVGVLHPVTGALAYSGQQCRVGALMAIEDINNAGGIKSMGGAKLEEAEGMAFLYDEDGEMSFWMKNTLIDLDIAFVGRDGTVLEVRTMTAGETETTTSVTKQARFAVEMRAGWFRDFGVKPGDKVNLEDLRSAVRDRGYDVKKFLP